MAREAGAAPGRAGRGFVLPSPPLPRYRPPVPDTPAPRDPALRTEDFDFALPERLVAQAPARPRDAARLLVVDPGGLAGPASCATCPGCSGPATSWW